MVEFAGVKIKLNNVEYILPTLSLGACANFSAFVKLQSLIKKLKGLQNLEKADPLEMFAALDLTEEDFKNIAELLYLSLSRNYQDITLEFVENNINPLTAFNMIPYLINETTTIEEKQDELRKNVRRQPQKQA
jgi:hypothetical protein